MLKPLTWLLPLLKVLEIHNGGKDLPQMQSCPGRQGLPLKEWATGQIEVPIPKANPNANPLRLSHRRPPRMVSQTWAMATHHDTTTSDASLSGYHCKHSADNDPPR